MPLKILHIEDLCTGCGACVSICPKNALTLDSGETGFYIPVLNQDLCINCGLCERSCQIFNTKTDPDSIDNRHYFMGKAKNKAIVKGSSSGGAFSLLADFVLDKGGVVYGARYNFDLERLEHCSTDNCSISELRKSKYIESYTGNIFNDVVENLRHKRLVLFVGTPCQIEGLYVFLKTKKVDTANLILVRFVCHGVPSNKFFTEYKHYEEAKYKSKMISFDFRPKTNGWRQSDWKMSFANGKVVGGPYYYYYYYYYFQASNILRNCCYNCRRVLDEIADITIADFWGIAKYQPENNDQDGISLIITHSARGNNILKSISGFEYLDSIPAAAVQYIEREVNNRETLSAEHLKFMDSVKAIGYMKTAIRGARWNILGLKIKMKLRSIIKSIIFNG